MKINGLQTRKVFLEYYRLEKDFEGGITLESTPEGFRPITGEAGRKEKKRDPLTVIIDKINEKYGTNFTEMDKVLLQMENDYAAQDRWHSYAKSNDRNTFMLLFEKDFPTWPLPGMSRMRTFLSNFSQSQT